MGMRPALIVLVTIGRAADVLGRRLHLEIHHQPVSMFALVFAIGILVDDAIVVVENIYRRWLKLGRTSDDVMVSG